MIILVVTVTGLGVDARYDLTSFNIKPHFDLSLIPFLQSFDVPSGHASRFTHRWEFLFFRCKMRPVEEELRWGTGNCHPPRVVISGYSGCVSKLRPWEIFTNFTTLSQTCIYTESPSPKSWHIHVNRGQCHGLSLLDLLLCEFAKGCWITTTTLPYIRIRSSHLDMNLGCHGTPKFLSKKISNERTRPTKNGQNGPLQSSRDNKNWTIESCANSNDLSRRGPP